MLNSQFFLSEMNNIIHKEKILHKNDLFNYIHIKNFMPLDFIYELSKLNIYPESQNEIHALDVFLKDFNIDGNYFNFYNILLDTIKNKFNLNINYSNSIRYVTFPGNYSLSNLNRNKIETILCIHELTFRNSPKIIYFKDKNNDNNFYFNLNFNDLFIFQNYNNLFYDIYSVSKYKDIHIDFSLDLVTL